MPGYGRLLVTGAAGFVGRHLLVLLRSRFPEAELIAACRPEDGALPSPDGADRVVPFDLLEPAACAAMIAETQPDGLIHLAAQASVATSFNDPLASWRANLMGTVALAEAVLHHARHCRFVLASSAEIYGMSFRDTAPLDEGALLRPANPYAASKAACDLAVGEMALRGLDAVRLRAFNHTGAGQTPSFVVASFARQIARIEAGQQAPVMQVGALDRWRDFLDVRDVCAAYGAALAAGTIPGAVYNIASGTPRRIGDILDALIARSGVTPAVELEPDRLRPTDVERVAGNAGRAAHDLGWTPTVPWDETLDVVLSDWRGRVYHS
ncbi:GDP-mannose 4,6-dehydratase [Acidisoma sp.]|uniref:GDP-mannose 4,6-dehydratase n=1 Tax=Acidisoma sp. TaxID=1872115 RepID=UPI003B0037FB